MTRSPRAAADQRDLFARAQAGDRRAEGALVRANVGLVYQVVHKLGRTRGESDMADLVSEGSIGLLTAVRRFEPDRGVAFSTYAYRWVEHHVRIALMALQGIKRGDAVRRPMKREVDALVSSGSSVPDAAAAVAARRGVRVETVIGVHARLSAHPLSLDAPAGGDGDATLGDLVGQDAETDEAIDRDRQARALRAGVAEFRLRLGAREARILDQRVLADDDDVKTLREVGDSLGICRERVRQLEVKLRERLEAHLLSTDFFRREAGRRRCAVCGCVMRRHNKRDRCYDHGPSTSFDMREGRCLVCGRTVPAAQRGSHALLHRRGGKKSPEQVRRDTRVRQSALRAERRAAGLCAACGAPVVGAAACAGCAARSRSRGSSARRRDGVPERRPRLYAHGGLELSLAGWAARTGVPVKVLFQRLVRDEWPVARALTEPVGARPAKEFCARGHRRTPDNLYLHAESGRRQCRACNRERSARRRAQPTDPNPVAASAVPLGHDEPGGDGLAQSVQDDGRQDERAPAEHGSQVRPAHDRARDE